MAKRIDLSAFTERFMARFPAYGDTLWSIDTSKCETIFEADMTWLNDIPSDTNAHEAAIQVRSYWKQELSNAPMMEALLQGELKVCQSISPEPLL